MHDRAAPKEKAAPSGTVDAFQQKTFDERTIPFAGIVVDNMMARPRTNVLLNELQGLGLNISLD